MSSRSPFSAAAAQNLQQTSSSWTSRISCGSKTSTDKAVHVAQNSPLLTSRWLAVQPTVLDHFAVRGECMQPTISSCSASTCAFSRPRLVPSPPSRQSSKSPQTPAACLSARSAVLGAASNPSKLPALASAGEAVIRTPGQFGKTQTFPRRAEASLRRAATAGCCGEVPSKPDEGSWGSRWAQVVAAELQQDIFSEVWQFQGVEIASPRCAPAKREPEKGLGGLFGTTIANPNAGREHIEGARDDLRKGFRRAATVGKSLDDGKASEFEQSSGPESDLALGRFNASGSSGRLHSKGSSSIVSTRSAAWSPSLEDFDSVHVAGEASKADASEVARMLAGSEGATGERPKANASGVDRLSGGVSGEVAGGALGGAVGGAAGSALRRKSFAGGTLEIDTDLDGAMGVTGSGVSKGAGRSSGAGSSAGWTPGSVDRDSAQAVVMASLASPTKSARGSLRRGARVSGGGGGCSSGGGGSIKGSPTSASELDCGTVLRPSLLARPSLGRQDLCGSGGRDDIDSQVGAEGEDDEDVESESEYEDLHEDDTLTFTELDELTMDELMEAIFNLVATRFNGMRVLNCPDWTLFLTDWGKVTGHRLNAAKMERLFAEEMQLQHDTRFRFELSQAAATRGLCFQSFQVLVGKAIPRGLARKYMAVKYLEFSGAARRGGTR